MVDKMEEKKEIKTKLDKIPEGMAVNMRTEVEKGTSDANVPLEAIQKLNKKKLGPGRNINLPKIVEYDGFKVYDDAFTLLFVKLVQMRNQDVDLILLNAQFTMSDIEGKPIFPRLVPKPTNGNITTK